MLIYLHGLYSSSRSLKGALLRTRLAPLEVRAVDYPAHQPDAAVECLMDYFAGLGDTNPAVVGSSMGGFYGQYIARHFALSHLFMINPALTPWTLTNVGLDEATIQKTRAYGIDQPCDGIATTLFLNTGDEVIDYRIAERIYSDCGRLFIWQGGDHAFQHMDAAIEVIRTHLLERADLSPGPSRAPLG
ncbi:hypothetical protein G3480_14835 [Thiorhodococcus mannitoliphagus]|uniref:Esterase n=1 Tax=Thiorhodococcus mannitoliphagus TaxID=329406 RepID=A0A6P1DVQ4_9GAMM|nr:YqiA/YcfP family alpha/beta fold hydrolase [Thiorhodococcus mannitoliphagus]NEX21570.1 hypothetical protein [Thiorhodococcus mannitoliphagus]